MRSASESRTCRVISWATTEMPATAATAVSAQSPSACASAALRTAGLTSTAFSRLSDSLPGKVSNCARNVSRSVPGSRPTDIKLTLTPTR